MYKIDYKPIEISLSKVESLMELIQSVFRDNGLAIRTTYIQYSTNYTCVGFDNASVFTLWSDKATDAIQNTKFQLDKLKKCVKIETGTKASNERLKNYGQ